MKITAVLIMAASYLYAQDETVLQDQLTRGVGEVHASGGVSSNLPIRGHFPVAAVGAAFGLNRWLGLTADYAYHRLFSERAFRCLGSSCGSISEVLALHEVTGGPRFSFTNSSGVVPYVAGLAGFGLTRDTFRGAVGDKASDTRFLTGASVGFDVKLYRGIGIVWDTRALYRLDQGWYGRTTLGMYLRGR